MSLTTTVTKVGTVLESVAGIENVRLRPGLPLDLDEAMRTWAENGGLQRWTVYYASKLELGGANANEHLHLEVLVVVERSFRESDDAYLELAEFLAAAQLALADTTNGFPQIGEEGIQPVETPGEPVRTETGEAAYRAQFGFTLIDVTST